MAAYAALVSLMNNMEQIKNHPHLSTSLDEKQIESLGEKVDFLLDFVESYNSHASTKEAEALESHIVSAAHAAEDVIESHVVDQILAGSTEESSISLLDLQRVMLDMDSIRVKVMEVKEKWGFKEEQPTNSMPATSSGPLSTGKSTMVGFDDELIQLMDVLTGEQSNRQIISIVGMGGIGKTTLARNVYEKLGIMKHFDVCAWAAISQEYCVEKILLELLSCQGKSTCGTVDELGEQLYKSLYSRRYLIILDDMWNIEVWNKIKFFFPDNENRSRVVLTTRLSNVAIHCGSSYFKMNFLDEDKSWSLFCEKVFGHGNCPPELEEIGKEIAKSCKGLPLSISVIGGLLRKSNRTIGYWQNVAENINSILSSGVNEQCLNVLSLSYRQLPAHLKPCFLYMGVFQEDSEILISQIIKLWVAEGFVRPKGAQILEEIAEGYLDDLVERNLILVGRYRSDGRIRSCSIHDLLKDLCLRVAEKEKFFSVMKAHGVPKGLDGERRLIFHDSIAKYCDYEFSLASAPFARSVICKGLSASLARPPRLLRVLHGARHDVRYQNVNLRYIWSICYMSALPSSISLIWNLQTLIIRAGDSEVIVAPSEIWKMPQLRHVECSNIYLPDPLPSEQDDDFLVLGNLQTLTEVVNFMWSQEACKRIPNIKKLHIKYDDFLKGYDDCLYHYLSNLGRLHKLESLSIKFVFQGLPYSVYSLRKKNTFPSALKKLSLTNCRLHWVDLTTIGSLPQLEVLKLGNNSVVGQEWNPVNGQFLRLRFLRIDECDLISWTADSSHFPVLEKLILVRLFRLDEIPLGIGEIPTLGLISLDWCSEAVVNSAMKIQEEQESLGNYGLQILVNLSLYSGGRFRETVERYDPSRPGFREIRHFIFDFE